MSERMMPLPAVPTPEAPKKVSVPPSFDLEIDSADLDSFEKVTPKETKQAFKTTYAAEASELISAYQKYNEDLVRRNKKPDPEDPNYIKSRDLARKMTESRYRLFQDQELYREVNDLIRNQFSIGEKPVDAEYLTELIPGDEFIEKEFLSPKDPVDRKLLEAIKFYGKTSADIFSKNSRMA